MVLNENEDTVALFCKECNAHQFNSEQQVLKLDAESTVSLLAKTKDEAFIFKGGRWDPYLAGESESSSKKQKVEQALDKEGELQLDS